MGASVGLGEAVGGGAGLAGSAVASGVGLAGAVALGTGDGGDGVASGAPHADTTRAMTAKTSPRWGSDIGPIVCRSGRVAPQP